MIRPPLRPEVRLAYQLCASSGTRRLVTRHYLR